MRNKYEVLKYCLNWYQTLSGQAALDKLDGLCAEAMSEIFGYYAIQTGVLSGQHDLLQHSRIAAGFSLASRDSFDLLQNNESGVNSNFALISSNEQLPISTDNVDLVVASHCLESSENPHQVLREIDRILVPEGHCILIGFNPFAISHIRRKVRFSSRKKDTNYKMRSVTRVRDWFSLLGFEVLDVNYMGFRPSIKNRKKFESLRWMETWGDYTGPVLGNLYVVHAKKQVIAKRPHKKVWEAPAVLNGRKVALNRTAQKIRRDNYSNL